MKAKQLKKILENIDDNVEIQVVDSYGTDASTVEAYRIEYNHQDKPVELTLVIN